MRGFCIGHCPFHLTSQEGQLCGFCCHLESVVWYFFFSFFLFSFFFFFGAAGLFSSLHPALNDTKINSCLLNVHRVGRRPRRLPGVQRSQPDALPCRVRSRPGWIMLENCSSAKSFPRMPGPASQLGAAPPEASIDPHLASEGHSLPSLC